jgi:hypothetical protein
MIDEEQLWEMYKTMSIDEIVEKLSVPRSEVLHYFKVYKFYQRIKDGIEIKCQRCGKTITVTNKRIHVCPECLTKAKQDRGRKLNERSKKLEYKKNTNNDNRIRPYTYTSNLIIQQCVDDKMDIQAISKLLDRDSDDLAQHIQWMAENKVFEKMRDIRSAYEKESRYHTAPLPIIREASE